MEDENSPPQGQTLIDSGAKLEDITALNTQMHKLRKKEKKQQLRDTVMEEMDVRDCWFKSPQDA
eukprot:12913968-Prorocentrum_lima.AAC.1